MAASWTSCSINMTAVLLLLETPPALSLRINNSVCEPGPLFKGVKGLPPGAHYVVYSSDRAGISKSSFFFYVKPREVVVRKWSTEDLEFIKPSAEEVECFAENAEEFDRLLCEYPIESHSLWVELTKHVRQQVINKVEPVSRKVWSAEREFETTGRELESMTNPRGGFFFTDIPKRRVKHGMSAAEITQSNFDKSAILKDLFDAQFSDPNDLLGEFEVAYLAFVLGENYEGLMQWKEMLHLLCNCEVALQSMPDFFLEFITSLYIQINQFPPDMLSDELLSRSAITQGLASLYLLLDDSTLAPKLYSRGKKLRQLMESRFGRECLTEELM
mmetsp:Transcript_33422/g.58574  ORF Transcript_33422/g.58574 Transcript_33422/m.58574 type:complete len:330 (+) Transcript_33422:10-999(+)